MENFIVAGILIVLIGTVIFYLVREKKKGRKCIGCPYAKQCGNHCSGGCGGEGSHHNNLYKTAYSKQESLTEAENFRTTAAAEPKA